MRFLVVAIVTVAAALAANIQSSDAQISFYNKRFCTFGGGSHSSGEPDCSYSTWEQCQASASGLGRYCSENPYWRSEGQDRRPQRATRRQHD
jgi:hypothetical protein